MVGHSIHACRKVQCQSTDSRVPIKHPNLRLTEDGPLIGFQGREMRPNSDANKAIIDDAPIVVQDSPAHNVLQAHIEEGETSNAKNKGPLWGDMADDDYPRHSTSNNEVSPLYEDHWNVFVNSPVYENQRQASDPIVGGLLGSELHGLDPSQGEKVKSMDHLPSTSVEATNDSAADDHSRSGVACPDDSVSASEKSVARNLDQSKSRSDTSRSTPRLNRAWLKRVIKPPVRFK